MQVGGRKKGVDSREFRVLERNPRMFDVLLAGACQPGNSGTMHLIGNQSHRLQLVVGSNRETCLDDVHAEALQLPRQAQLVFYSHTATGGLLAIPQAGVKNRDLLPLHAFLLTLFGTYSLSLPETISQI